MSLRTKQWKTAGRAAGNTVSGRRGRAAVQGAESSLLKRVREAFPEVHLLKNVPRGLSRARKAAGNAAEKAVQPLKSPWAWATSAALVATGVSAVFWFRHAARHAAGYAAKHTAKQAAGYDRSRHQEKGKEESRVRESKPSEQREPASRDKRSVGSRGPQREGEERGREPRPQEERQQHGQREDQPRFHTESREDEQQEIRRSVHMAEEERPERFRRPEAAPGTAFATERAVAGAEPAGKRLATELYLYGIIGPVAADWEPGTGVGDPPGDVFLIRYGNIAAVVSDVESGRLESEDPGALRQDMQAHYEVQGRVLPFAPLLPVRFGVALPNRDTARRMLAEHYEEFVDQLERLRGKVEVELRIRYREEPVIEELTREEPSLLPSRRWGHGSDRMTYAQRIELGESVMRALRTKKLQESHRVLAQLSPLVEIEKIHDGPEDELTMLEAAFLLDHRMLGAFEEEVEKLRERESDRVEVVCVGPLPAYSFVDQTVAV